MAAFQKFNCFPLDFLNGLHNFSAHTFKVCLVLVAPIGNVNTQFSGLTEIAEGNGYLAGGRALANPATGSIAAATVGGRFYSDKLVWTAATGSIDTFRYVVLYNSSAANKNLIGWWDLGGNVVITVNNTLTLRFSGYATAGDALRVF